MQGGEKQETQGERAEESRRVERRGVASGHLRCRVGNGAMFEVITRSLWNLKCGNRKRPT